MNPNQIKHQILAEIKKQKVGASQQKLAEMTGFSRPTVIKYLQVLQQEGEVKKVVVGRFPLWTYANNQTLEMTPSPVYVDFIQYTLKALEDEYENVDWKKIGLNMAKYVDSGDFIRTEVLKPKIKSLFSDPKLIVDKVCFIFEEILTSFCKIFHLGDVQLPIVVKTPPILIFRINIAEKIERASIFQIISGLIQEKVTQEIPALKFSVDADYHEISKEENQEEKVGKGEKVEKIVDITLSLLQ